MQKCYSHPGKQFGWFFQNGTCTYPMTQQLRNEKLCPHRNLSQVPGCPVCKLHADAADPSGEQCVTEQARPAGPLLRPETRRGGPVVTATTWTSQDVRMREDSQSPEDTHRVAPSTYHPHEDTTTERACVWGSAVVEETFRVWTSVSWGYMSVVPRCSRQFPGFDAVLEPCRT